MCPLRDQIVIADPRALLLQAIETLLPKALELYRKALSDKVARAAVIEQTEIMIAKEVEAAAAT